MLNKFKELRESREEGFTLIELLVVIVIIGVLAAIALPIFLNQQRAAIRAGMKADVRTLQTSVATYIVNHPTATNLDYRAEFDGATFAGALSADSSFPKVTGSDSGTILVVRKGSVVGSGAGTWDGYVVLAANKNASANNNNYVYFYDSTTGKYVEQNS